MSETLELAILPFQLPFMQTAFGVTLMIAVPMALLSCLLVLKGWSLMGDAVSHAVLPGVVIAYIAGIPLAIGAFVAGLFCALLTGFIKENSRIKEDTAQALVLTVFFGAGIVLLTYINRTAAGGQTGLDRFLFGQSAGLLPADVWTLAGLAATVALVTGLFFKELALLCFDPDYGRSLGFPVHRLDQLLAALVVVTLAVGLQAAGVVLTAALLILPPLAARYWTDRLVPLTGLAGAFGAAAGVAGTAASSLAPQLPTGPLIVLSGAAFFAASFLASPRRGLLAGWLRALRNRRASGAEAVGAR